MQERETILMISYQLVAVANGHNIEAHIFVVGNNFNSISFFN